MAGDIVSIGAVAVDYRRPNIRMSSQPTTHGIRPCTISGLAEDDAVDELGEMMANPALQVTKGGYTGVQEWVECSGRLVSRTGYYILMGWDDTIEHSMMFTGFTEFSISAAYLGPLA